MTKLTFDKIKTFVRHYPWIVVAIVLVAFLVVWLCGCEATGPSPSDPERKITRSELQLEIETFLARAERSETIILQKEQLRDFALRQTFIISQGGAVNYYGLATSLLSILGIGSILDNRRKDSIIKIKKEENQLLKNAN